MRLVKGLPADLTNRDELVMAHVGLVRALASRLGRRLPTHVEGSELISVGVIGLIDAASRYQPTLGVPFEAFARRRVHGAMIDWLRGLDCVPRSVRRLQRDVETALIRLRHVLGREPEDAEIAQALGVSQERYFAMLDELQHADAALIRSVRHPDGSDDLVEMAVDGAAGPYARLERQELRAELARALAKLPERERQILTLSYGEELTLAEIGQVIGLSESRVSQLRTQAVARLRSGLQDWVRASEAA
jgi:RNA polymerase sigma factor for flagellar operon FliA